MKVLIINSVCGIGSTGKICTSIADELINNGNECIIAYGRGDSPKKYKSISKKITNELNVKINALKARLLDNEGLNAKRTTKKFVKWAERYNPDIVWLHNLHGYYINYEILFKWIKSRPNMQVKWTLHDCWAFTGHCAYFSHAKCEKWRAGCEKCLQLNQYPASLLKDNSFKNYIKKSEAFCNVKKMTVITVSHWLENLVKNSFLKDYKVEVVYNKVDASIFKPSLGTFKKDYNIADKKMILGVANVWDKRKGLFDFVKLSTLLNENYIIVLVGLNKKQIKSLPSNIIGIERTNNIEKLVEIYSEADVFVNPSKEETFGLTTVEAKLCGTTPIVYEKTACEEVVKQYGGVVVKDNIEDLYSAIIKVCEEKKE